MSNGAAILIVDDSEHLCNAFRWILSDDGYTVYTATGGRAALACLASVPPPGLILLDRHLPDMTGLEVLAAIQADPAHASIPVVMMSGRLVDDIGELPLLLKPVDASELLSVAHRYAGRA
jgi:CheY-like chemotaxis protein